ncbi:MAG: hypothetical protein QOE90_136 [Thermoplasmata archaeon]|jgi:hypothetical protein|nr:hypothetical protein [Thermoplasmata archaeon]
MKALAGLVLLALLALPFVGAIPSPALPQEGPDVPAATAPVATIVVLDHARFTGASWQGQTINVPAGAWNRVVLTWSQKPIDDPWDRTFSASIGGVEVLRGTTPRTEFTVTKDVTRYAALLPAGGSALVEGYADSWVGQGQVVTLSLAFYDDPSAAAVEAPAAHVFGVQRMAGMGIGGSGPATTIDFGATVPQSATVEFLASGHGDQEDWFLYPESPPTFTLLVDGQPIASAVAMPYTYAFLGFCDGPGCTGTAQDQTIASVMWWTAQQALDLAGVHTGVGEIPAYRATVAPQDLALLTGAHTVQVVLGHDALGFADGSGVWVTSAQVLTG